MDMMECVDGLLLEYGIESLMIWIMKWGDHFDFFGWVVID